VFRLLSTLTLLLTLRYTFSIAITCKFGYQDWVVIGNVYTCDVKNLDNREILANVTEIEGTHLDEKTNSDVRKININLQMCQFLPFGFEKFFPNIEGLRIAHSNLVSLTQSDISVFPKLRSVDIFNNNLKWLDADVFEKNPEIEYLYFGDNQIKSIGYDALKPLKKLKHAVFHYNVCLKKNAIGEEEIQALQEIMNQNCDPGHKTIATEKKRINELEVERTYQKQKIKELEEIVKVEDSQIMWMLWIFIPLLVLGILAAVYFYRNRSPYQTNSILLPRSNGIDIERLENETNDTNGYSSGATNLI
ncbi:CLUMA_CG018064, isoform A, partial [Clunio marinus]